MRVESVPIVRAPRKDRPAIAVTHPRPTNSAYPYGYVVEATSEVAKRLEQRAKKGEQGGLPEMVPAAFLYDVAQWAVVWLHHEYGHSGDRSALNFQEDLCDHWPAAWILWMFQSIGYIKYTDAI